MPGISRVNQDTAGGLIIGDLSPAVLVEGKPIAVKGAQNQSHGVGTHASAVMVGSSSTVFASGIEVCREGDEASCGDTATGSFTVFAGD